MILLDYWGKYIFVAGPAIEEPFYYFKLRGKKVGNNEVSLVTLKPAIS
jgi:hypothetical protein